VLLAVKQEMVMCDTLLRSRLPSFPSSLWAKFQLHKRHPKIYCMNPSVLRLKSLTSMVHWIYMLWP